ncbi:hypothetical protein TH5_13115 [Thalassospira xianhensis MCCC 1A02616]|uniref:Uncharacterized protein n=1 Tax=Thalassospira xianhensis MCCC 1A02616 TaxID=1177929 RepID=A0A367UB87_9PROT|nr:hypothetical protein TH5_13115 [Thalassospira xianhensis MCCC 1A02616]
MRSTPNKMRSVMVIPVSEVIANRIENQLFAGPKLFPDSGLMVMLWLEKNFKKKDRKFGRL